MNSRPSVGIGVFIFKQGKFLIGKRQGAHGHDSWTIPGGHLEWMEDFEDTARREVLEETGLNISNVRFGAVTNDKFVVDDKHYVTVWMLSDWQDGVEQIMEPEKYIEQRWVDFETLPENLFLPWNQLLRSEFIQNIREQCHASEVS